jgi:hypothetical protein
MEILSSVSIPISLKGLHDILKTTWDQFHSVKEQKAQCQLLIERCTLLFLEIAGNIESDSPLKPHLNDFERFVLLRALHVVELHRFGRSCLEVKEIVSMLAKKGLTWRILHQSRIKVAIISAEQKIADACTVLNVCHGTMLVQQLT